MASANSAKKSTRQTSPAVRTPKQHHSEPELDSRFVNRDESWLLFNARVLEEATDTTNPLLERLKFLAITASNLDEFLEIRVAGILQRIEEDLGMTQSPDEGGFTLDQRLERLEHRSPGPSTLSRS